MSVRQEQVDTSRAAILVQRLQDSDEGTRERAKKDIALFAKESEQSREQVIRELIKLMESSDVRLRLSSPTHYDAWTFAAGYLGEIKATEAIDALVSCIDCNNGVAGLSRLPAYKAIVMIGPQAVAKLTDALDHGRPEARQYSALALGEIGGAEAKKALGDALQQEEDKEVITCIKMALSRL
jgi:HEAT repeat protein